MLFPAVIHSDDGVHYGIFLPDIPGAVSGGHSPEECLGNIQEAVEMVCAAKGLTSLPAPSRLADVMASEAAADGWVMPAPIDTAFLDDTTVRIHLSLPEDLVARIDARARAAGLSRSAYLTRAALA